jgi:hypothetical protein
MFRTTNQGCLSLESGIRAATAQLNKRKRRIGLRLLSLPEGDQVGELTGANTAFGTRTVSILGHSGRTEMMVLPPEAAPLQATVIIGDEAIAKWIARDVSHLGCPSSRTARGRAWARSVTPSPGVRESSGKASRSTWGTTKKPMTPSAQPLPENWERLPADATLWDG